MAKYHTQPGRNMKAKALGLLFVTLILTGLAVTSTISVSPVAAATYEQVSAGGGGDFGGKQDDAGYSIKLTSDNGLILAGYTKSFGNGGADLWLVKTAPASFTMQNGVQTSFQKEQWNVTYGGEEDDAAYSVVQTTDGGYAAAGYTRSYGSGGSDAWLVKFTSDGSFQWRKVYGGAQDDAATSIVQTSDGGYLLAGYTNSDVNSQSAYVIKTDSHGDESWSKTYSGKSANSISTADGGFALAIEYSDSFGLITIDSSGNPLIEEKYAAPKAVASTQAVISDTSGYAIAGWIADNSTGTRDAWLIKTDTSGKQQWSKTFPGFAAYSLLRMANGDYALSGDYSYLVITDPAGKVEWNQPYDNYGSELVVSIKSIIEASPNHFVFTGTRDSGTYGKLQMYWSQVALKSGAAQTTPPKVNILSPQVTTYTQRNVPLTFHVDGAIWNFMYALNDNLNISLTGNTTLTNMPNGDYSITVYAIDNNGNRGASQTVAFSVNNAEPYVPPKIEIQSPTDKVYYTSQITLTFKVDQTFPYAAYQIDDGIRLPASGNSNMMITVPSGKHTITVYAGWTESTAASANVAFTVNVPQPTVNTGPTNSLGSAFAIVFGQIQRFLTPQVILVFAVTFMIVLAIALLLASRRVKAQKQLNPFS